MTQINLEEIAKLPAATEAEATWIFNRLEAQQPTLVLKEDCLAILAFGGTIQSAYVPAHENIVPVPMNPAFERITELREGFRVSPDDKTGAILLAKDSRDISNADLALLIHTISLIPNKRILVSCGTYMLKYIAMALDIHFGEGKSDKIIGVIGSWLPATQEAQDVDFNIGGGIAAINAFNSIKQKGLVFAQFHGEIYRSASLKDMDLHAPGVNPKFARPVMQVR